MPKRKKKAHEMTDKELLRDIFPQEVIAWARKIGRDARKVKKK